MSGYVRQEHSNLLQDERHANESALGAGILNEYVLCDLWSDLGHDPYLCPGRHAWALNESALVAWIDCVHSGRTWRGENGFVHDDRSFRRESGSYPVSTWGNDCVRVWRGPWTYCDRDGVNVNGYPAVCCRRVFGYHRPFGGHRRVAGFDPWSSLGHASGTHSDLSAARFANQ